MCKLIIDGPCALYGEVSLYGAKNAVLPIMAATILSGGKNVIRNCPNLADVDSTIKILRELGCRAEYKDRTAKIDSSTISGFSIDEKLMREMRSSIIFLGAIISKCRRAVISYPGGCEIGPRPIDLHLKAFRQLGVDVKESHGFIYCALKKYKPQTIHLLFPSVGATENIMLLAAGEKGETIIENAAKEPEIVDLQNYLNLMGANVSGAGSEIISIKGVKKFRDADFAVMPDRIVACTYLCAAASCGGEITLKNANDLHIQSALSLLAESGCEIERSGDNLHLKSSKKLRGASTIKTMPYPGFPTDAQAIMMAVLSKADGATVFVENMFENRYKHVEELTRMGADITVDGRVAVVRGVPELFGANVKATDLRGGAALVVAGLAAQGTTEISNIHHIDRGYENIEREFASLGCKIRRV